MFKLRQERHLQLIANTYTPILSAWLPTLRQVSDPVAPRQMGRSFELWPGGRILSHTRPLKWPSRNSCREIACQNRALADALTACNEVSFENKSI